MSSFGETLRNSWLLAVGDSFELSAPAEAPPGLVAGGAAVLGANAAGSGGASAGSEPEPQQEP